MNQPVMIGVTPLYDAERDSLWMVPGYLDGIMQAGAVPIVLPLTHDVKQLRALFDCGWYFVYRWTGCQSGLLWGKTDCHVRGNL